MSSTTGRPICRGLSTRPNFDFDSKTLRGVETQRDRWKRGIGAVDGYIGEGLGELYVKKHFPPGHKAKVDELIANLRAGTEVRGLESSAWMDAATRAEALEEAQGVRGPASVPGEMARLFGSRPSSAASTSRTSRRRGTSSGIAWRPGSRNRWIATNGS